MSQKYPHTVELKFAHINIDVFPFLEVGRVGTRFSVNGADLWPEQARALAKALVHAASEVERFNRELYRATHS